MCSFVIIMKLLQIPRDGVLSALKEISGINLNFVAVISPGVDSHAEQFADHLEDDQKPGNNNLDVEMVGRKFDGTFRASFSGLSEDVKYNITVRTVVNGKMICQMDAGSIGDMKNKAQEQFNPAVLKTLFHLQIS